MQNSQSTQLFASGLLLGLAYNKLMKEKPSLFMTEELLVRPIKSFTDLTRSLGYETTGFREFTKELAPVTIEAGGEKKVVPAHLSLSSMDNKYGPKGEKIYLRIQIGWLSKMYCLNDTTEFGLNIAKREDGFFGKEELKNGGYQEILELIKRLANEKFFDEQQAGMEEQLRVGQNMVDNVITPQIVSEFPNLKNVGDRYLESGKVYFWGEEKRGRTTRGLVIEVWPGIFELSVGNINTSGDNVYMTDQSKYTVAPPEMIHSGWHYKDKDEEDAKRELQKAMAEVKKSLI